MYIKHVDTLAVYSLYILPHFNAMNVIEWLHACSNHKVFNLKQFTVGPRVIYIVGVLEILCYTYSYFATDGQWTDTF